MAQMPCPNWVLSEPQGRHSSNHYFTFVHSKIRPTIRPFLTAKSLFSNQLTADICPWRLFPNAPRACASGLRLWVDGFALVAVGGGHQRREGRAREREVLPLLPPFAVVRLLPPPVVPD